MSKLAYRKVIIIGAPRTGTNMLRDALCDLPDVATWPCDEINPIWRHGNLDYPFDDFDASRATEPQRSFVRACFDRIATANRSAVVVEKTCANTLRVPYVTALLPEAQFVFIRRDGWDAVASAIERWRSKVDLTYTLRKARFVPPSDISFYARCFLRSRFAQRRDRERRLPAWGPMTHEIAEFAVRRDIVRAAATQWSQCTDSASTFFAHFETSRFVSVRYEDLVQRPFDELARIISVLGLNAGMQEIVDAVAHVRADRTGHGRAQLNSAGIEATVGPIIGHTNLRTGYRE